MFVFKNSVGKSKGAKMFQRWMKFVARKNFLSCFFDDTYDAKIMIQNFNFYDI